MGVFHKWRTPAEDQLEGSNSRLLRHSKPSALQNRFDAFESRPVSNEADPSPESCFHPNSCSDAVSVADGPLRATSNYNNNYNKRSALFTF